MTGHIAHIAFACLIFLAFFPVSKNTSSMKSKGYFAHSASIVHSGYQGGISLGSLLTADTITTPFMEKGEPLARPFP